MIAVPNTQVENALIVETELGKGTAGMSARLELLLPRNRRAELRLPLNGDMAALILRLLDTVGVDCWEQLYNSHLRVLVGAERIFGLSDLLSDRWWDLPESVEGLVLVGAAL